MIIVYDDDGLPFGVYDTIKEASEKMEINRSTIRMALVRDNIFLKRFRAYKI